MRSRRVVVFRSKDEVREFMIRIAGFGRICSGNLKLKFFFSFSAIQRESLLWKKVICGMKIFNIADYPKKVSVVIYFHKYQILFMSAYKSVNLNFYLYLTVK